MILYRLTLFLLIFLLTSSPSEAATKEKMLRVLEANKKAIEVNKRIVEKLDDNTYWFIAINEYGMLIVIPMNKMNYETLQTVYKVESMTLFYMENKEKYENGNS